MDLLILDVAVSALADSYLTYQDMDSVFGPGLTRPWVVFVAVFWETVVPVLYDFRYGFYLAHLSVFPLQYEAQLAVLRQEI